MQLSSCGEGKLEIFGNNWCTLNPIWRALSLQLCFQRNLQLKTFLKISVSLSHTAYVNVQIDLENINIRYFRFKGGVGGLKIKKKLLKIFLRQIQALLDNCIFWHCRRCIQMFCCWSISYFNIHHEDIHVSSFSLSLFHCLATPNNLSYCTLYLFFFRYYDIFYQLFRVDSHGNIHLVQRLAPYFQNSLMLNISFYHSPFPEKR